MAVRPFSYIIYGASGFTGKYCIEYMVKCLQRLDLSDKWAIAGRNASKLLNVKNEVSDILGVNLDNIPIVIADNDDSNSILRMCEQCDVLINCVGPYTFYGESVVKACIQAKTHQVDLTAEETYVRELQIKYQKAADEAGILIINFCGIVSVVWDAGINYMKDAYKPMILNSVESMASGFTKATLNRGTLESYLEAFSNFNELLRIRKQMRIEACGEGYQFNFPQRHRVLPFYSKEHKGWVFSNYLMYGPVMELSQYTNYKQHNERPAQFGSYVVFPNFMQLIILILIWLLIIPLTRCRFGIRLLQKYMNYLTLGIFTNEGPTRKNVMNSPFRITLYGKGWRNEQEMGEPPNVESVVVIEGPNAAYITTSICLICAAITVKEEFGTKSMPLKGGITTPGVAFRSTKIVQKLNKNSVTFSVIK